MLHLLVHQSVFTLAHHGTLWRVHQSVQHMTLAVQHMTLAHASTASRVHQSVLC